MVAPNVPVRLATDPSLPAREIGWSDFVECVRASIADNLAPCAAIIVVAAKETIDAAIEMGLCHTLLWRFEHALAS